MRRLTKSGFGADFVRRAILPDWWDRGCSADPTLLPEIELRVARFLSVSVDVIRNPTVSLAPTQYPDAQLRHARSIDRDRLGSAIHSALQIGAAVVRNMREAVPEPSIPPANGLEWRELIAHSGAAPRLADIVSDLWTRGIPVVPLDVLPTPSFQGMACVVENRPVIVLAHKYNEPGRVAFIVAHEAGHIAGGDCTPSTPVVDQEDEISDQTQIEIVSETFARQVLLGAAVAQPLKVDGFKDLASKAMDIERTTGADASVVILSWARETGEYSDAAMAMKALYRAAGARGQLRTMFDRHVDQAAASETDRALLRCVYGESESDDVTL